MACPLWREVRARPAVPGGRNVHQACNASRKAVKKFDSAGARDIPAWLGNKAARIPFRESGQRGSGNEKSRLWHVEHGKNRLERLLPVMLKSPMCDIPAIALRSPIAARKACRQAWHIEGLWHVRRIAGRSGNRSDLQSAAQPSSRPSDTEGSAPRKHVLCEKPITIFTPFTTR